MSKLITLITCQDIPKLTPDDHILVEAIKKSGHDYKIVEWERVIAKPDMIKSDLILFRSPWNYYHYQNDFFTFLDILEKSNIPVLNPIPTCRWNIDKNYLLEFAANGTDIVPTVFISSKNKIDLKEEVKKIKWPEFVVKPTLSAGSFRTWKITKDNHHEAENYLKEILSESDAMIQPFLTEVTKEGEISFIFFKNEFSHAVIKKAAAGDFRVQNEFGGSIDPYQPTQAELTWAQNVIKKTSYPHTYARVDVIPIKGQFHLSELELIEPCLYFKEGPGSAEKLLQTIFT